MQKSWHKFSVYEILLEPVSKKLTFKKKGADPMKFDRKRILFELIKKS